MKESLSAQNYAEINVSDDSDSSLSSHLHSRAALKDELTGRVQFDSPGVLPRLGFQSISDVLVQGCFKKLREDNTFQEQYNLLSGIVDGTVRVIGTLEKAMYKPLHKIITMIEDYQLQTLGGDRMPPSSPRFRFHSSGDKRDQIFEVHTLGFPYTKPGFSLLEADTPVMASRRGTHQQGMSMEWRYRVAFGTIKASVHLGPRAATSDDIVTETTQQAADYARLHMSARPFQLFSVGLFIYGLRFCVAIFDREGVTFSPEWELGDTEGWMSFIRLIRALTHQCTHVDLGQDPTSRLLRADEPATIELRGNALGHVDIADNFPTYAVTMGGNDQREWGTIAMIWSSISLIGRGTAVWLVRELVNGFPFGPPLVLKSSWRGKRRTPESDVYLGLITAHPGVANFQYGADVRLPGTADILCVSTLRGTDAIADDPTLHRLFLSSVGRPIWEYRSEVELVRGLRAAVEGHRYLFENGVLHRDISAGNVLLAFDSDTTKPGSEGFITDLDYAHIERNSPLMSKRVEQALVPTAERTVLYKHVIFEKRTVEPDAHITGTVQFMSSRLLFALRHGPPQGLKHLLRDDLESFLWVLGYAVKRHSLSLTPDSMMKRLHEDFISSYGRLNIQDIYKDRRGFDALSIVEFTYGVSGQMQKWFQLLQDRVLAADFRFDSGTNMTYTQLLAILDEGIACLEDDSI